MTKQLAVRIPEELARRLDELVAEGRFPTRTDAVRAAIGELVEREQRQRVDAAIVAGYRRVPPTEAEQRWADAAGRQLLEEESW